MADRPGVIFYFSDWEPLLKLDDIPLSKLFRAAIRYAKDGTEPDFEGMDAILWGMIAPKIDRDGERFQARKESGEYAVYCREAKKEDKAPLSFDRWKIEKDRSITNDNESNHIQLQDQKHNHLHTHNHNQLQTHEQLEVDSGGGENHPPGPLTEEEKIKRRDSFIEVLESRTGKKPESSIR